MKFAAQQQAFIEDIRQATDRFFVDLATVSKEMKLADVEARKTAAMLRAVAAEVREVMEPYREMYQNERLSKAKAEALKAGVPELVVDAIVSRYLTSRFPSKGTLMKYLGDSGGLKKLASASHGNSLSTVAGWLGKMRKIMIKHGHLEKYRGRINVPPATPSDLPKSPEVEEANDSPDDGETGLTDRDTRNQELGDDDAIAMLVDQSSNITRRK